MQSLAGNEVGGGSKQKRLGLAKANVPSEGDFT